jgi:hypothetical protein
VLTPKEYGVSNIFRKIEVTMKINIKKYALIALVIFLVFQFSIFISSSIANPYGSIVAYVALFAGFVFVVCKA